VELANRDERELESQKGEHGNGMDAQLLTPATKSFSIVLKTQHFNAQILALIFAQQLEAQFLLRYLS
jgi:hypothetical protein